MKKKAEQVCIRPRWETAAASSAKIPAPPRAPFRASGRIEQRPRATGVVVKKKAKPLRVSANAAGTNSDNFIEDGRGVSAAVKATRVRYGLGPSGAPFRTPGPNARQACGRR